MIQEVMFRVFRNSLLENIGCKASFVQENQVKSHMGALRGLHYQLKSPQGKLVWVSRGSVFDVAVDIRYLQPFPSGFQYY